MSLGYPYLDGLTPPAPTVPLVPMATDVDRLRSSTPALTERQAARVEALLASGSVISLHDHPVSLPDPMTAEAYAAHREAGRDFLGFHGLSRSGLTGIVASAMGGMNLFANLRWLAFLQSDIAHSVSALVALHARDFAGTADGGPEALGIGFGLEDLASVGTDLSGIELLYGAGVRVAGLTYNAGNDLGCGLGRRDDSGLTQLGRSAVELMNAIGMVVDLAHVGDRTSLDAAAHSSKPVVISHAGARGLWGSARMKPDDVLRAMADTGGVIGIEAAPNSTRVPTKIEHDLDAAMQHVVYCAELVGVEHVALGPDTLFGDHFGMYAATGASPMPPPEGQPAPVSTFVDGMENPGEAPRNAAAWLVAHDWNDEEIRMILGSNVLRVFREVLA